jgi:hypothetical protein
MNSANLVRVTKIKVKKDKVGLKWATIELTRPLDEQDSYTPSVRSSIEHMRDNKNVASMKLSEQVEARNLIFYAALGIEQPSEMFPDVEIGNFRLKREESEERDWLMLTFDFTIPLENARKWIIPSIGDDILCVVEDAQLSFPKGEA